MNPKIIHEPLSSREAFDLYYMIYYWRALAGQPVRVISLSPRTKCEGLLRMEPLSAVLEEPAERAIKNGIASEGHVHPA
jgi:hypothetical protein